MLYCTLNTVRLFRKGILTSGILINTNGAYLSGTSTSETWFERRRRRTPWPSTTGRACS